MDRHQKHNLDRWLTTPPEQDEAGEQAFRAEVELGFTSLMETMEQEGSMPMAIIQDSQLLPAVTGLRDVLKRIYVAGFETGAEFAYDDEGQECRPVNEPETPEYDPGPEVDDEGGMSEHHFAHPDDY